MLGPILEASFRRSMLLSDGSFSIFVTRPYSGAVFGLMLVVLVAAFMGKRKAGNSMVMRVDEADAAADAAIAPNEGGAADDGDAHSTVSADGGRGTGEGPGNDDPPRPTSGGSS
ncbi:MAG: hypothetical protein L0H93_23750 [Nocardioides sp.]|nr:hypothetical protein [Nocardioides sp.]